MFFVHHIYSLFEVGLLQPTGHSQASVCCNGTDQHELVFLGIGSAVNNRAVCLILVYEFKLLAQQDHYRVEPLERRHDIGHKQVKRVPSVGVKVLMLPYRRILFFKPVMRHHDEPHPVERPRNLVRFNNIDTIGAVSITALAYDT